MLTAAACQPPKRLASCRLPDSPLLHYANTVGMKGCAGGAEIKLRNFSAAGALAGRLKGRDMLKCEGWRFGWSQGARDSRRTRFLEGAKPALFRGVHGFREARGAGKLAPI